MNRKTLILDNKLTQLWKFGEKMDTRDFMCPVDLAPPPPHLLVSALKDVAILFSEFYCFSYQNLFWVVRLL